MTEPPLILPSAVLPKSLHNLPSAFVHPKEVLLMKGGRNRFLLVGRKTQLLFIDSVIER